MKDVDCERIIEGVEEASRQAGHDFFKEMGRLAKLSKRYGPIVLGFFEAASSRSKLRAFLKRQNLSPEIVERLLKAIPLVPALLRAVIFQFVQTLPTQKGRRPLDPETARKACGEVWGLMNQGYSQAKALKEVRTRYNISVRTMYRKWNEWRQALAAKQAVAEKFETKSIQ